MNSKKDSHNNKNNKQSKSTKGNNKEDNQRVNQTSKAHNQNLSILGNIEMWLDGVSSTALPKLKKKNIVPMIMHQDFVV